MSRSSEYLDRARELVRSRLSPDSFEHSTRVADQAAQLAACFGVDVGDAELAGLLHDLARDESDESLLALARELGVPATPFEQEHAYLLHARVGAAIARRELPGIGEGVLSAIETHTVGGLPMSDLDRVIYLADMVEPARYFPGVEDLRAALESEPLAECFRLGYGRTLRYIMEKGRPAHPISSAVSAQIERETGRAIFDPPAGEVEETPRPFEPAPGENDPATVPESGAASHEDAAEQVAVPAAEADAVPAEGSAAVPAAEADAAPAEGSAAVPAAEEEPEHRVRRVRRRRAGHGHHAHTASKATAATPAGAASSAIELEERPHAHAHGRTTSRAGRVLRQIGAVIGVVLAVALVIVGLVFGVNAAVRWNALRVAGGAAIPTSDVENNLLVIGVNDGVATGFTALKAERTNKRVLGIAIPDGAFVEVPGQGFERIGASFIAGADVSKDTVSNYLGVPFKRYIVVNGTSYQALLTSQDVSTLMDQVVSTDLSQDERHSFATYFGSVVSKNVWIVPLPVKPVAVGDQRYYEPQRDQVADLLLQWWGVKVSQQKSTPRVIVYNGVGTPGLAGLASQQLIRTGFRIVNSGNADSFNYAKTVIYLYHGTQADALAVRQALGVGEISVQSSPQELTDMIVIIGADYRPPVDNGSTVPTGGVQ